jgi:hypothetical protein
MPGLGQVAAHADFAPERQQISPPRQFSVPVQSIATAQVAPMATHVAPPPP